MPRKSAKKPVQTTLFDAPATAEIIEDDGIPASRERFCGRCRKPFWSEVQTRKPMFVPLFCLPCGKFMAMARRMRVGCRTRPRKAA